MAERRAPGRRALVVEDDAAARGLLVRTLEVDGFDVSSTDSAGAALGLLRAQRPRIVLLDTVLPGGDDGLALLGEVRRITEVPVMFVSGRDDPGTRVLALRRGADDYVLKPFSPTELLARVEAVLRRSDRRLRVETVERGWLRIELSSREAFVGPVRLELTRREFDLLAFLAASPRQVFSREQLLEHVWRSWDGSHDPATVTEHVHRLRRKLAAAGAGGLIATVRGGGYRLGSDATGSFGHAP